MTDFFTTLGWALLVHDSCDNLKSQNTLYFFLLQRNLHTTNLQWRKLLCLRCYSLMVSSNTGCHSHLTTLFEIVQLAVANCSSESAAACANSYGVCVESAGNSTDTLCTCYGSYLLCLYDNACFNSSEYNTIVVIIFPLIFVFFKINCLPSLLIFFRSKTVPTPDALPSSALVVSIHP
jgi:hypothetical protein